MQTGCKIFCRKGLTLHDIYLWSRGSGGRSPPEAIGYSLLFSTKILRCYSVLSKIFKEAIYINIKWVGATPYVVLSHTMHYTVLLASPISFWRGVI